MDNVWDRLALLHYHRLSEGKDFTFHKIFKPVIIDSIQRDGKFGSYDVLDAGCGTGVLTNLISKHAHNVVGIDNSAVSIEIAKHHNKDIDNVNFDLTSLKLYSESHTDQFDFVISHLVLHVIQDLDATLQSISNCLKKNGRFLFSIPHPCFWALTHDIGTWNFFRINDYDYHTNSIQQNSIKIERKRFNTPHYHRSIETYFSSLNKSGFMVERIIEPVPDEKLMQEYNKKPWPDPRFLFMLCSKN